ncbi:MAG: HD-GYP domain-containing protein, partial [Isosphaeraceae bacterium]
MSQQPPGSTNGLGSPFLLFHSRLAASLRSEVEIMSSNGHTSNGAIAAPAREVARRENDCRLQGLRELAESLAREFTAPVGVLDPVRRTWQVIVGAQAEDLPRLENSVLELAGCGSLRLGRAVVWHSRGAAGRVWLILPLPWADVTDAVAFVGFEGSRNGRQEGDTSSAPAALQAARLPHWGPVCPDRALQAWGQKLVNEMQSVHETHVFPIATPSSSDDESERMVIGRLIRRMRISDSPTRFQGLATTVLRTSLGMAAVAWVPAESDEPVVVSGGVEELRPSAYRALLPANVAEVARVVNDMTSDERAMLPPLVQRFATVAAGSAGWLVAVNPADLRPIGNSEIERMQYVASLIATQASNAQIYAELKELLFGIIRALTAAIDAKDPRTSGHSERVARIAVRLAEELGMPPQKRSDLYLAGLLHDIGKIGINDRVLLKAGPLTPEEYQIIRAHVEIGVTILKDLKKLRHILPGVRHHHESMDGTGYPDRLSGEDIPFEARILAVADAFDAMSSDRVYRKRLTSPQVQEIF